MNYPTRERNAGAWQEQKEKKRRNSCANSNCIIPWKIFIFINYEVQSAKSFQESHPKKTFKNYLFIFPVAAKNGLYLGDKNMLKYLIKFKRDVSLKVFNSIN